ncbi:Hypothetical protein NCS54_00975100 [Fusarium falciforme]|uniref:Hypothetical protein n=1 Tax=Fusarium falciforme TaxID=195108 RepID=UPI002301EDDC|nr:Hypothetical protein NCS54_00975100 [Fusarium falciforme]WAO92250.1 Hypothetical protein NCS54_00975100 [Fusarium falciforme]
MIPLHLQLSQVHAILLCPKDDQPLLRHCTSHLQTRRIDNMCTTTITRFYCIVCSYLVSFEQDEEECEYVNSKTPQECKLAIKIKQKSVDPQQCHKCEAKLHKKKQPVK